MTTDEKEPMNLGALRDALSRFPANATVQFAVFNLTPTTLDSWRGIYAQPALGWKVAEYGDATTVATMLADIDAALDGKVYSGYKDGDYIYDRSSPVMVDNWGNCGRTALVGVTEPYPGGVYLHVAEATT